MGPLNKQTNKQKYKSTIKLYGPLQHAPKVTRLTLRSLLQTTDYVQGGVLNFLMTCQSKTIKFFNVLLRFKNPISHVYHMR